MPALGSQMKALLAAWDDATAPLDARVRDDPLLFASQLEITASSRVKRLTGLESDESDESADVCHPWDHAEFLARVSSFSIASWFAKLDAISAFECARHGWKNSAPDQLHCNCCKQFLCFKIDDRLSGAGALKVAETFAGQLVTGHTQLCPWRGNPSPEAFTTLPIATKRQVYESFMDRLQDEVTRMYEDADFQKRLSSLKVADRVTAKILQEADSSVSSEALVNAAFLAVCGWQFDEKGSDQVNMMWCGSCNRRWQVAQESTSKCGDEQSEPPAKRRKVDAVRAVDLLSQHRHFCPWVAGRSSTGVDDYGETDPKLWEFVKLPGWKQYAQALALLGNPEQQAIEFNAVEKPISGIMCDRAVLAAGDCLE
ncbi:hypothetical protein KRP22_006514 [Phytophthora ramorum]|nr:Nuclear-interacting partner of ALK [Phytophthora ramorum]